MPSEPLFKYQCLSADHFICFSVYQTLCCFPCCCRCRGPSGGDILCSCLQTDTCRDTTWPTALTNSGVEEILQVCVLLPTTQTHKHTFGALPPESERERLHRTNSGRCQSQAAPASVLRMAPMGPEIRPQAHKPARSCQGAQRGTRGGTRWHSVAWCHFAPQPVTWKHWGQTERELHCVLVCIFGIGVGANTVGRVDGSGGLTLHGPSAAG